MKGKTVIFGLACILGMGLERSMASAPILLTINDSNPAAVVITATGLDPGANDTAHSVNDGVDLLAFFGQSETSLFNTPGSLLPNTTLSANGSTLSYNDVQADNVTAGGDFDLSLYVDGSVSGSTTTFQNFSTTQPAFTGSWTINFSSLGVSSSALPGVGSTGQLISGYSGNPGSVIGEWQIAPVPEPGAGSLLLLGSAAGLIFWRRRARKDAVARG